MKNNFSSGMTSSTLLEQPSPVVGFRFHPTDYELVNNFLKPKIFCHDDEEQFFTDIKVCDFEPWELPGLVNKISEDQVWYFFCYRDYKYSRSRRSNRRTKAGFWKPTGKPRKVMDQLSKEEIGTKRSLVFYIKDRPKSIRTKWIMHEYEYIVSNSISAIQGNFVLCKLKAKPDAENINKCESSNLKLNEMTINSSCDESELTIDMAFDFEKHNLNDMNVTDYAAANDENCNPNEMTATSTYANDKLDQHPNTKIDVSASDEGEWSSLVLTPSDFDLQNQNQYEKTDDISTSSIAVNVDSNSVEATPLEGDVQAFISSLEALLEPDDVDKLNSAIFPPMSPSESGSYASFGTSMLLE